MTTTDLLVKKDDVRRMTAYSISTIDRAMASGALKYQKLGRRSVRFYYKDVLAWIDSLKRDPQRAA
jgi:predicted DNA-binding transcriptional regulator AlpA